MKTTTHAADNPHDPLDDRLANHPMFSPTDLAYFRRKGYSDAEILAFWDRDHAAGREPCRHATAENDLTETLREYLSPQAVAMVAAYLRPVDSLDTRAVREVRWFRELLIETVGGEDAFNRLAEEAGL